MPTILKLYFFHRQSMIFCHRDHFHSQARSCVDCFYVFAIPISVQISVHMCRNNDDANFKIFYDLDNLFSILVGESGIQTLFYADWLETKSM